MTGSYGYASAAVNIRMYVNTSQKLVYPDITVLLFLFITGFEFKNGSDDENIRVQ